jgi:hypothetical protein
MCTVKRGGRGQISKTSKKIISDIAVSILVYCKFRGQIRVET